MATKKKPETSSKGQINPPGSDEVPAPRGALPQASISETDASSASSEPSRHLAWFLGPKAENRAIFEELLVRITQDYMHWRMNYFPEDELMVQRHERSSESPLGRSADALSEHVDMLLAKLRRNFPFYSPRYIAHMLSDVTMPATLGYYAGLLYNANNVTTEAAPVTVEMELEACNALLEMCGFVAPKQPGADETLKEFQAREPHRFGWAHTTFDGTTATIEALWIARTVRYLPLTIAAACDQLRVDLPVRLWGSEEEVQLRELWRQADRNMAPLRALCLQSPRDTLQLLQDYVEEVSQRAHGSIEQALEGLRDAEQSASGEGTRHIFSRLRPVVFASGAAHYSLEKACDILGIGHGPSSIRRVGMDSSFRMDLQDLKRQLLECMQNERELPLVVICVCATTEEGAVDPIADVVTLRKELELQRGQSFWLHVDAAWGGYLRSLLIPSYREQIDRAFLRVAKYLHKSSQADSKIVSADGWQHAFRDWMVKAFSKYEEAKSSHYLAEFESLVQQYHKSENLGIVQQRAKVFLSRLMSSLRAHIPPMDQDPWEVSGIDAKQRAHEFLCDADDRVTLNVYGKSIEADVAWTKEKNAAHATQSSRVLDSLLAMAEADAVVCDPHKMGYLPYPCGFVAYSDNRSRRCIQQEADYISALNSIEDGFNLPARYPKPPTETKQHNQHTRVVDTNSAGKPPPVHVEALMRSMLEGSRPGAVASSLWLHSNVISPTIEGHGHIVRASLLAARELYVWLSEWERLSTGRLQGAPFEFRIVTEGAPDTNVVVFTLQPKNDNTLKGMNDLTEAIYDKFSIKAELGAREYSYTKEFFVSRTLFKAAHYAPKTMKSFFGRSKCNILDSEEQYPIQGLQVIRAAVMSPYLFTHRRKEGQNLVREFVVALDAAARNYLA